LETGATSGHEILEVRVLGDRIVGDRARDLLALLCVEGVLKRLVYQVLRNMELVAFDWLLGLLSQSEAIFFNFLL
jgi:hypothetical protein